MSIIINKIKYKKKTIIRNKRPMHGPYRSPEKQFKYVKPWLYYKFDKERENKPQVLSRFHLVRRTNARAMYSSIMKKTQQNNDTLCLRRSQLTAFALYAVSISLLFLRYLTKAFKGSKSLKKWTNHFLLASRKWSYYCAKL